MAKRTNLRLAVAELGAVAPAFDAVTTFSRPGERFNPDALLVERGRVMPDPDQPRKHFDDEALEELADSIRQYGILQPLVVRPLDEDGKYAIVNGERRYRAALLADLPEIPVIVRDSPADRRVFEMLIENLQRADLTIEEEAWAYQALTARAYSEHEIARRLGLNAMRVSRIIRLYTTPALYEPVLRGQMTKSQAFELLAAPKPLQSPLAEHVVARRQAGDKVGIPRLRDDVQQARRALRAGTAPDEIMESVTSRYTPPEGAPTPAGKPTPARALRPALVTLNNLAREIESFCDRHGATAYTDDEREPLRHAWRRLGTLLGEDLA